MMPLTGQPATRSAGAQMTSVLLLVGQAVLIAAYVVLLIVPFLTNGLHAEPAEQVAGGRFDPKDLWPYHTRPIGPLLAWAATLANAFTWLLTAGLALGGVVLTATNWSRLGSAGRLRTVAVIALAIAFFAYQFSTTGRLIGHWMAD
jgi:hypothetical protein